MSFALSGNVKLKEDGQHKPKRKNCQRRFEKGLPTASTIISTEDLKEVSVCLYCNKEVHRFQDCIGLQILVLAERKESVSKKSACFACLKTGQTSN